MTDDAMGISDAAREAGRDRRTILRWITVYKTLPAKRAWPGGPWIIKRSDLDKLIVDK